MFDAETLVKCLRYWSSVGAPVVWGGSNPSNPPQPGAVPPHGASIKWWCDHVKVDAHGTAVLADQLHYGFNGLAITLAYREAVASHRVLSALFGGRRWFVLHPGIDVAAYAEARRAIVASGRAIPVGWP